MGCNCGKKRTAPQQGSRTTTASLSAARREQPSGQGSGAMTPTTAPTTARTTQSFALQLSSGKTLTFGSRLEADAENVRRGMTGKVRPA